MKKIVTVVAVIALVAIVASPAMANRAWRGGYGNVAELSGMRGIDLTAEQTEKLNAMRETQLKDIKPLQDQLYSKSGELRLLWLSKTPDQEKIMALQKEVQNLRNQMAEKATTYRLEARKILTPEQLTKIQSYGMGRGMARMGGGSGMMGGHGYGWGRR